MVVKVGRHQGSFMEGHVRAKRPNSLWARLVAGPQNAFNVDGVWWLEGQTLNSSTNMFLDLMEIGGGAPPERHDRCFRVSDKEDCGHHRWFR